MTKPLFCIWNKESVTLKESNRILAIKNLNLIPEKTIPVFDEATQTAANSLGISICCLGILLEEEYQLKSAFGLSKLGLMNDIAKTRKIHRNNAFATHVIDSGNSLVIENALDDIFFKQSILTQHYGIIAYLGVPIFNSNGLCIGCLEIIDTKPRQFSTADINFLTITARWCIAEYEKNQLITKKEITSDLIDNIEELNKDILTNNLKDQSSSNLIVQETKNNYKDSEQYIRRLSFQLLNKLTQKLSIPLTSVIGMSSVLKQEIYGKLNPKQLEYLEIIHDSGKEMITLVDEVTKLASIKTEVNLEFVPVDLENLGTQVIKSLESVARSREHTLRLSIEPGEKIWNLDREKVKKTLYYLLITIIEGSRAGGEIQIHISQRLHILKINCWVTHPWLGDGISFEKISSYEEALKNNTNLAQILDKKDEINQELNQYNNYDYDLVCLLFSAYLASLQKGNISLQGSTESTYRFVISIPIPN
ncbi:two-component sensor histidine kinase [Geminocystis sp. NIES-3708]|uniref:GAF domain-containing sensor histidine kinase n=1 Tax=Geminocystis sp. NIES-3708 TaxID=1615909 RepID=UPI0005FC3C85|nr:GAF domain-containing protein [Geminocystis sp. NIES-3708]BAQ60969.1 two-component sensor histidine kinase [Geminocystis sp. NIES-3708]